MAGGKFAPSTNSDPNAIVEVLPLRSYEDEGLASTGSCDRGPLSLPVHLVGPNEVQVGTVHEVDAATVPDAAADGFDTRPYYLQEYPRRLEVSCSQVPRFLSTGGPNYYTDAAAAAAVAAAAESEVDHHWNGVCCSNWALSLLVFFGGFSCAF